jgi:hypothetical protein
MESRSYSGRPLSWLVVTVATITVFAALLFVSRHVSSDYFDHGSLGLVVTMFVGWAVLAISNWRAKRRQPLAVSFLAVGPWALGFGGAPHLGFILLPFEALASALILGFVYRDTGLSMGRAALLSVLARSLAIVPLLL